MSSPLEIRIKQMPDEVTPINPAADSFFSVNRIQVLKTLQ
jgi:hypothetical protein